MRKKITYTLFFFPLLVFSGCDEIDFLEGAPHCIKGKIRKEKDECLEKVYAYYYKGRKVYGLMMNCPNMPHCVYDKNCNSVCCPGGGVSGNGDGKCPVFSVQAKNETLIWQK
ncbi:MAG: DUF6970 domain-containing protein [Gammaproteobacteria bacterium]